MKTVIWIVGWANAYHYEGDLAGPVSMFIILGVLVCLTTDMINFFTTIRE